MSRIYISQLASVVFAMLMSVAAIAQDESENYFTLTISAGQSEIVDLNGARRVAVGRPEVLKAKVLEDVKKILLTGTKEGVSDLRVWDPRGHMYTYVVNVVAPSADALNADVRAILRDLPDILVRTVGDAVVLEGRTESASQFARVDAVAQRFGGRVINYVSPPVVDMQPTVLLQARLLEVRRNALKELGINWEDAMSGPTFGFLSDWKTNDYFRATSAPGGSASNLPLNAGTGNKFWGISTSVTSIINLLVSNGDALLLAEPTLTCISGETAEFLAGGELPIPLTNADGAITVEYKQYGVILKISPLADSRGYIRTKLGVEVSSIDPAVSVLGIPGFLTRKTDTEMNVQQGQTMVIAGLLNRDQSKEVDKVPGLGHLPVVGELFKSRRFRNNETELVVLVTPRLLEPEGDLNRQYGVRFEELKSESADRLSFNILD